MYIYIVKIVSEVDIIAEILNTTQMLAISYLELENHYNLFIYIDCVSVVSSAITNGKIV